MVFKSKIDTWLAVILFGVTGAATAMALVVVIQAGFRHGAGGLAVGLLVLGFCVWLFRTTDYRIDGSVLHIRSGPFRWRVPIEEIEAVEPTHNPLSSPALSLDRLQIDYRGGMLLVSPRDREGFVRALREVNPGIRV